MAKYKAKEVGRVYKVEKESNAGWVIFLIFLFFIIFGALAS